MKYHAIETITATALVRHFSSVLDKVRMSGRRVQITKGASVIAELCPPPNTGFPINHLAAFLKSLPRLGNDAATMSQDLKTIRNQTKHLENPWES